MDHNFTEQIKQWLKTPEAERDYTVCALYLLKLSGNQILYRNIVAEHIPLAVEADKQPQKGKREDHDLLPDEIKAKYVENRSLLQRIPELHLRLRSLSLKTPQYQETQILVQALLLLLQPYLSHLHNTSYRKRLDWS